MEKDDELKGEGNSVNYEARMQDTRVGRFLSIDPLTKSFPHYSPYQFAGNTPIQAIDLDGAEEYHYLAKWDKESGKIIFKLESDKTVKQRTIYVYDWIPDEKHTVVYQNSSGETTEYVFPKGGKKVQTGGPTSTPEILNTPASLRKFVSDSNKIRYQDEDSAEKAFEKDFLSTSGDYAFTAGNALIVGSQFYTPVGKTPVEENAPQIKTLDERAREIHSALPEATQKRTTTAVADVTNPDGTKSTLVGSSEVRLRPSQRKVLTTEEIAVKGSGHAEQTVINHANANGQKVNAVGASRPICSGCEEAINNANATPVGKLKGKK